MMLQDSNVAVWLKLKFESPSSDIFFTSISFNRSEMVNFKPNASLLLFKICQNQNIIYLSALKKDIEHLNKAYPKRERINNNEPIKVWPVVRNITICIKKNLKDIYWKYPFVNEKQQKKICFIREKKREKKNIFIKQKSKVGMRCSRKEIYGIYV